MQIKLLFALFLLITAQAEIITIDSTGSIDFIRSVESNTGNVQNADVYFGTVEINIENGDRKKLEFYGTFVQHRDCFQSRCYYGWVNNYTISGQDTVIGFADRTLEIKPVFELRTNSEVDFVIIRHPKLAENWIQIIEVLCQKVNPQIIPQKSENYETFRSFEDYKAYDGAAPQYNFRTVEQSDLKTTTFSAVGTESSGVRLAIGDKITSSERNIWLEDFKTQTSLFSETLVLGTQNIVKSRKIDYQLQLESTGQLNERGQRIPDFGGIFSLNFGFLQRIQTPTQNVQIVQKLLRNEEVQLLDLRAISERRAKLPYIWDPSIVEVVDQGPTFEEAEIPKLQTEKYSGVNVVEELSKAPTSTGSIDLVNVRFLQVIKNDTVYEYKKVIISKTIFGKTFEANVEVKCYLLTYSNDHQVQCVGNFNYQLFGKMKTITIFSFQKSVSFSWSWSKTYSGNWDFSIGIALPAPVDFIGITFNFKVSYVINVKIDILAGQGGINPYQIKVNTLATTKVDTDSSAGVKVVAIEGGVFISGTLVNAGTDPKLTLTYYFGQKYVNIVVEWYFWVNAFNYNWGFYYKTWSLWSGWSGRKIIKQWTISGVYGKWAILNKNFNLALP